MSFLHPGILWFLLLIPVLAGLIILAWRSTGQGWRKLVSAQHQELVTPRALWRTVMPATFALLALTCMIVALARPINGYREGGAMTTGRNLLIALDISRSMETEDVKPSRLAEARAAAYELIDALPGDKIGLIVFSGEADLVVPLTYDHTALRDALEQVNRNWAGVGGTNFGLVLRKAMLDFKRSTPEGSTNALVILSDGEDTVNSSLEVAEEAKKNKLLVITVGIGTAAGGPVPDANGENGLWQDRNGKHVISKLNSESLRRFAEATGGDYFVMDSNADLTAFTQAAVRKIDKHEEAFSLNKVPNDLFSSFATTALILLALAMLTSTEWRSRRALLLLLILGSLTPHANAAPAKESATAYAQGISYMQSNEQDKAKESFSLALLDEDKALQAAAHYQMGQVNANRTFQELRALYTPQTDDTGEISETPAEAAPQVSPEALQKIVDSLRQDIQPYRDALKLQPSLSRAQKNITGIEALIRKLEEEIERLKQQQQDKQNDQQKQNSDQQQDKQDNQQKQDSDQQKDKQDDQQKQDSDQQQNKQDDQQKQNSDQQQDKQNAAQPEEQETQANDEERKRQYAASVLRRHMDEEDGSPIPHANDQVRQPDKDY